LFFRVFASNDFFNRDIGNTVNGYSVLWLSILYLLGAYIKKYDIKVERYSKTIIGYLLCVLITWGSKLIIEFYTNMVFGTPRMETICYSTHLLQ